MTEAFDIIVEALSDLLDSRFHRRISLETPHAVSDFFCCSKPKPAARDIEKCGTGSEAAIPGIANLLERTTMPAWDAHAPTGFCSLRQLSKPAWHSHQSQKA